jgi:hypothetical protein
VRGKRRKPRNIRRFCHARSVAWQLFATAYGRSFEPSKSRHRARRGTRRDRMRSCRSGHHPDCWRAAHSHPRQNALGFQP